MDRTSMPPPDSRSDPATLARELIDAGYAVVPVRRKTPWDVQAGRGMSQWQLASFADDLDAIFDPRGITGVGVNLGRSGLADIDCDTLEAVQVAARLLPPTATFGRPT